MAPDLTHKLAAKWAGPYCVVASVGPVAFRLALPPAWKIHDIFHVSQLCPAFGFDGSVSAHRDAAFTLLPMTMMSLRLRISLIIALAVVPWNTLLSGKVTLSLNPLGNRPLTYIVHAFCCLIINAEDCIEAVGGG